MSKKELFCKIISVPFRILPLRIATFTFQKCRGLFSCELNSVLNEHVFAPYFKHCNQVCVAPTIDILIPVQREMVLSLGDNQRIHFLGQHNEVAAFLLTRISSRDVFIDVGANCGLMTLVASVKIPGDRVYCFEPNPEAFEALKRNAELNHIKPSCFNLALSDCNETCRLFIPDGDLGGGSFEAQNYRRRELQRGEKPPTRFVKVQAKRLDDLVNTHELSLPQFFDRIVVKIDAEGHERAIVRGMRNFIRAHLRRIVILIEVYESEFDEVKQLFDKLGLAGSVIRPDGSPGILKRPEKNCFKNYVFEVCSQLN